MNFDLDAHLTRLENEQYIGGEPGKASVNRFSIFASQILNHQRRILDALCLSPDFNAMVQDIRCELGLPDADEMVMLNLFRYRWGWRTFQVVRSHLTTCLNSLEEYYTMNNFIDFAALTYYLVYGKAPTVDELIDARRNHNSPLKLAHAEAIVSLRRLQELAANIHFSRHVEDYRISLGIPGWRGLEASLRRLEFWYSYTQVYGSYCSRRDSFYRKLSRVFDCFEFLRTDSELDYVTMYVYIMFNKSLDQESFVDFMGTGAIGIRGVTSDGLVIVIPSFANKDYMDFMSGKIVAEVRKRYRISSSRHFPVTYYRNKYAKELDDQLKVKCPHLTRDERREEVARRLEQYYASSLILEEYRSEDIVEPDPVERIDKFIKMYNRQSKTLRETRIR